MTKIYESPDGGRTIYERLPGSTTRKLVKSDASAEHRSMHDRIMEDKLWGNIRRMGKVNPTMREELDRVIMLYYLLKEGDSE